MTTFDYSTTTPSVHHRLTGTPHIFGAKYAVGQVRKSLRNLAAVLDNGAWTAGHQIDQDPDAVSLSVIELVDQLGPAERHALRICTSLLVRVAARNGYHNNN
jgi:hypothetical protein